MSIRTEVEGWRDDDRGTDDLTLVAVRRLTSGAWRPVTAGSDPAGPESGTPDDG